MVEDRRLDVLRAIIEDFVATGEPVGSRSLVERHQLGVSPATVRNDMASLEEQGLIAQPHTSAGRVPTDLGYRLFVDRLSTIKPLSAAERRAIETLLDGAVDLDDVVDRTVRLLAQLTGQVAVVQYPSLRLSTVRHVELVPEESNRLLVVIITDTGRVEQRTLELAVEPDLEMVNRLRTEVNVASAGRRLAELANELDSLPDAFAPEHRDLVRLVTSAVVETLELDSEERVVLAGTANLARGTELDFHATISPVLEALEEQMVLLRLLGEISEDVSVVSVRIGHENDHAGLTETSFVGAGYGMQNDAVARLGVLGPTRMNYPTNMASVRAVARYVSRILTS